MLSGAALFGVPGMAYILEVKVLCGGYHRYGQPLANIKGVTSNGESERRWRQSPDLTDRNRI